jgi:fucose permease
MANSVYVPYLIMAAVLALLAILIRKAPLPHVEAEPIEESNDGKTTKTSIFQFPQLILGVVALFMYVGVEVIAGDSIIAYGLALELPVDQAKWFTTFTLFAMVGTYALGVILIPKVISQKTALQISGVLGIILSLIIVNTSGFTSVLLVASLGVANALVWPAVWPLAIDGLGKFTKTGAASMIMAISGGAILTPLYGKLVDYLNERYLADGMEEAMASSLSSNQGYLILLPAYIIIFLYAIKGHKIKSWK